MNVIKLGIPKGSLEKSTIELFARSGWKTKANSRNYFPTIDDPEINCGAYNTQKAGMVLQKILCCCFGFSRYNWCRLKIIRWWRTKKANIPIAGKRYSG